MGSKEASGNEGSSDGSADYALDRTSGYTMTPALGPAAPSTVGSVGGLSQAGIDEALRILEQHEKNDEPRRADARRKVAKLLERVHADDDPNRIFDPYTGERL